MRFIPIVLAILASPSSLAADYGMKVPHWTLDHAILQRINIIGGEDGRDSILRNGAALGLSRDEIARIRATSGYVGCLAPSPSVGSAALFLNNRQIVTAAHVFFDDAGKRRRKCFFRNQAPEPVMVDLALDDTAIFGAPSPKPGSNNDFAVVQLAEPFPAETPFPVAPDVPVRKGDPLIVVTAHPAGMDRDIDRDVPVTQSCMVRRTIAAKSAATTSFYRSDCDASGGSSGSMNLSRVGGRLVFRGITITTGPWQEPAFRGAPYDEAHGSVTTALGVDAAILAAGRRPKAAPRPESGTERAAGAAAQFNGSAGPAAGP